MAIPVILGFLAKGAMVVGAASGISGAKKMYDGKKEIENQQNRYERAKKEFDKVEQKTEKSIIEFGQTKLKVWQDFKRFSIAFEKIKNRPEFSEFKNEGFNIESIDLEEIKGISISAIEILGSAALAGGAGVAVGMATSSAVVALGTASTGTLISGLSGAAATNATLAWLGGGSLAAGGGGMAAGTVLLGNLILAPALVIGGLFLNAKGNDSEENTLMIKEEVNEILVMFGITEEYLKKLDKLAIYINRELIKLSEKYIVEVSKLEQIVEKNSDYNNFTESDKIVLDNNIKLVSILKSTTDIVLAKEPNLEKKELLEKEETQKKKELDKLYEKKFYVAIEVMEDNNEEKILKDIDKIEQDLENIDKAKKEFELGELNIMGVKKAIDVSKDCLSSFN